MTAQGRDPKPLTNPLAHPEVPTNSTSDNLSHHLDLVADGMMHLPEAAKFLGIGKSLLYIMMGNGERPVAKIHGRTCIPRRALVEYAARQLVLRPGE